MSEDMAVNIDKNINWGQLTPMEQTNCKCDTAVKISYFYQASLTENPLKIYSARVGTAW